MSKASKVRDLVMTSSIGAEYGDATNITEVWSDLLTPKRPEDSEGLEGIYCLRICGIFYDLIAITEGPQGYSVNALVTRLQNKPSVVSKLLGRLVATNVGEESTSFDWEKCSEKDEPENKVVFGGAYSTKAGSEVCWGEDMKLCIRIDGALMQVSNGPVDAEQGKMLANAINSYVKRCERFHNPLPPVQRKPRQKKEKVAVELPAEGAANINFVEAIKIDNASVTFK